MFRKKKSNLNAATPQGGKDIQESFDHNDGAAQTPSSVKTKMEDFNSSRTPNTKSYIKKHSPKPMSPKKVLDNPQPQPQQYFNPISTSSKNFETKESAQPTVVNPSTVDTKMSRTYKTSSEKQFTAPKPVVPVKAKDIPKAPAKQLIIGAGVMVKADITEADLVLIEGCVEGTINAKCIKIRDGGSVFGEATCDVAYIAGIFTGPKLITSEKLQVGSTGKIKASISYNIISMDAGAVVTGMIVNCPPKVEEEKVEEKPAEDTSEKKEEMPEVKEPKEEDSKKDEVEVKKESPAEAAPPASQDLDEAPTPLS